MQLLMRVKDLSIALEVLSPKIESKEKYRSNWDGKIVLRCTYKRSKDLLSNLNL